MPWNFMARKHCFSPNKFWCLTCPFILQFFCFEHNCSTLSVLEQLMFVNIILETFSLRFFNSSEIVCSQFTCFAWNEIENENVSNHCYINGKIISEFCPIPFSYWCYNINELFLTEAMHKLDKIDSLVVVYSIAIGLYFVSSIGMHFPMCQR